DLRVERLDRLPAERLGPTLRDDERALPVVAAVNRYHDAAERDAGEAGILAAGIPCDAEPEDVDPRADILHRKAGGGAHGRVATVASDGAVGANLERTVRRLTTHTDDAAAVVNEPRRLGLHAERERRQAACLSGDEVEEVPLRHHRDERIPRG